MSAAGDVTVRTITREVTTHTRDGERTEPYAFVHLTVNTPNGALQVEIDAGDWSRALATPGLRVPASLDVPGPVLRTG